MRTTNSITLQIHICDQRRAYLVTFEGANAEPMAIDFLERRKSTHASDEVEEKPIDQKFEKLLAYLYPECNHGLSQSNCYGPQHYYFDEEEQARGMFNS